MADGINETNQEERGDGRSDGGQAGFRGGRGNREGGGRDGGNRDGGNREGGNREGGNREGGNREGGNRESGGFRIRLSDNEMRAARAVQEAFGLRSTVAALGLSIRTVAQLLDEGKLDELVAQQRAAGGSRPQGGDRERRGGRPEGRGEGRGEARGERGGSRPNPFARPSRPPAPAPAAVSDSEPTADEPATEAAVDTAAEVIAEADSSDT